jgi:hypothetical protein
VTHSPLREALPMLGDRQLAIIVSVRHLKWNQLACHHSHTLRWYLLSHRGGGVSVMPVLMESTHLSLVFASPTIHISYRTCHGHCWRS